MKQTKNRNFQDFQNFFNLDKNMIAFFKHSWRDTATINSSKRITQIDELAPPISHSDAFKSAHKFGAFISSSKILCVELSMINAAWDKTSCFILMECSDELQTDNNKAKSRSWRLQSATESSLWRVALSISWLFI